MTKLQQMADVMDDLIEYAELGKDQIEYEVKNRIQGSVYNEDDVKDAKILIRKAQRLVKENM